MGNYWCLQLMFKLQLLLQVTGALNYLVRMTCDLESYAVAVERVNEYSDCPQEVCFGTTRITL